MSFASLGHYRRGPIEIVIQALSPNLTIYSGTTSYEPSIVTLSADDLPLVEVPNIFLPRNILIQKLPWRQLLTVDSLLLDLNPRMPHVWVITVLRRIMRKRTVLWGHAWPRAGRASRSEILRGVLRSLPDGLVAYTYEQARELSIRHPKQQIYCAPNSIYRKSEIRFNEKTQRTSVVYVGRIHADKKPAMLLHAFERVAGDLPEISLVIAGTGPDLGNLRRLAAELGLEGRVHFAGHVTDHAKLTEIYDHAFTAASPGYVGLSITQAFSFGVPMLISELEPHAPEFEAAEIGHNSVLFRTDDVESLASQISSMWHNRQVWSQRGPAIAEECAARYSVEQMAAGIVASLQDETAPL